MLAVGHMHPACQPAAFVTLTRTVPYRLLALPHFRAGFLGRGALDGHPRECSPPCRREEPGLCRLANQRPSGGKDIPRSAGTPRLFVVPSPLDFLPALFTPLPQV